MPRPIAILEDTPFTDGVSAKDNLAAIEAARNAGFEVISFSADFELFFTADEAFDDVVARTVDTRAIWVGFIPSFARYEQVYAALSRKRIQLVNRPEQHRKSMEFDRYYDLISDLTAESRVVTSTAEAGSIVAALGVPLFVKGSLQSAKARGWASCVANDRDELVQRIDELLADETKSRGKVIVRKWLALRHVRISERGVPQAREYRVFVYDGQPLALGAYWPGEDALTSLSGEERSDVLSLASQAAQRTETPYLAVDIAQKMDGSWTVIEIGDAQFAGASHTPLPRLWERLRLALES